MLAIIFKDLFENYKGWLFFACLTAAALLISEETAVTQAKKDFIRGFVETLAVAGSLVFTQTVISSERKRRHLILLKSLPVDDYKIVLGKFSAVLILGFSLLNIPYLLALFNMITTGLPSWLLFNAAYLVYSSMLLTCAICFKSPIVLFVPLYITLAILLMADTAQASLLFHKVQSLTAQPLFLIFGSAFLSFLLLLFSVRVFQARELDL